MLPCMLQCVRYAYTSFTTLLDCDAMCSSCVDTTAHHNKVNEIRHMPRPQCRQLYGKCPLTLLIGSGAAQQVVLQQHQFMQLEVASPQYEQVPTRNATTCKATAVVTTAAHLVFSWLPPRWRVPCASLASRHHTTHAAP